MEFPHRNGELEDRVGTGVRQCRGLETGQSHSGFCSGPDRNHFPSGHPKGLFNLVMGPDSDVGQLLVESLKVNVISFTGSVPISKNIAA